MSNWSNQQKWGLSFIYGLLFLLIASPFMYKLTGKATSSFNFTTSTNGCPNVSGLILHSVVFFLLVRIIMCIISCMNNTNNNTIQNSTYKKKNKK